MRVPSFFAAMAASTSAVLANPAIAQLVVVEDASDASVGYSVEGMPAEITIYLYSVRDAGCQAEHDGARDAIMNRGGSVRASGEGLQMP